MITCYLNNKPVVAMYMFTLFCEHWSARIVSNKWDQKPLPSKISQKMFSH